MDLESKNITRILKEILEYSEDLRIAIDKMAQSLDDGINIKGHFFTFNEIAVELKHRYYLIEKIYIANYFYEDIK